MGQLSYSGSTVRLKPLNDRSDRVDVAAVRSQTAGPSFHRTGRRRTERNEPENLDRLGLGRRSGPGSGERGAALVETAIVTPLFLFIVFFILETGLLFRDSLTTDNASREGARAASTRGDNADADYFVLRTVEHGLEAMGLQRLQYVVVFRATGPGDDVPPACLTSSQANLCNRYTAADFFAELDDAAGNDTGNFRCGTLDSSWCPTTRETSLTAGTDFVGVHVQTRHDYITNFFTGGTDLGETTILRLEPDED